MRILDRALWLAGAISGLVGRMAADVLLINPEQFVPQAANGFPAMENRAVLAAPEGNAVTKPIFWTTQDAVVTSVVLFQCNPDGSETAIATGALSRSNVAPPSELMPTAVAVEGEAWPSEISSTEAPLPPPTRLAMAFLGLEAWPQRPSLKLQRQDAGRDNALSAGLFELPVETDQVIIPDLRKLANNPGKLYFAVMWEAQNQSINGTSFSRFFTVLRSETEPAEKDFELALQDTDYTEPSPAQKERYSDRNNESASPPSATLSAASAAENHDSRRGLSAGAVFGIAVGISAAAIMVLGAIIFLIIHRRRANLAATHDNFNYGGGPHRSPSMENIADKEAHAGVASVAPEASSPHTLHYSDSRSHLSHCSGGPASQSLIASVAGRISPSPDYGEQVNSRTQPASQVGRALTGTDRGIPSGAASSLYAHLIEEGMSEDDIRRIEYEERLLDAAIAEASGRR